MGVHHIFLPESIQDCVICTPKMGSSIACRCQQWVHHMQDQPAKRNVSGTTCGHLATRAFIHLSDQRSSRFLAVADGHQYVCQYWVQAPELKPGGLKHDAVLYQQRILSIPFLSYREPWACRAVSGVQIGPSHAAPSVYTSCSSCATVALLGSHKLSTAHRCWSSLACLYCPRCI